MSAAVVRLTPYALGRLAQEFNTWRASTRARLARSRRFVAKQRRAAAARAPRRAVLR